MWAPADLFTRPVSMVLFPMKEGVTYLYEHTFALALLLIAIAAVIAVVEARTG